MISSSSVFAFDASRHDPCSDLSYESLIFFSPSSLFSLAQISKPPLRRSVATTLLLRRHHSVAPSPPLRCFAFTVPFSLFLFFSLAQISFSQFLFFSLLSRSNLKATTPPLRLSVATTPLLRRHHSVAPPSPPLCCSVVATSPSTPPLRFRCQKIWLHPTPQPQPVTPPTSQPQPVTPPTSDPSNLGPVRTATERDLTPPADAISDLVLFVDRLVRPVPMVEPLA
ncbi:hypothetical protein VIGAN_11172300 [Vigna angularis var. angularis]|uniref:Uncharacterized protein n=1 Tax=Vigna angularis var. angularis TaxID=157739 RepID=A0A0S3TBH2_PHAAN|nr:hypothetical protein VIGAN_11172300 [Vigna angularis var. angularis]